MSDAELVLRLGMSMVFGLIVGIERQWHHKNAGIKTNTLVSLGSTAFALISARGFGPTNNPAAIAAGVVTGIGFIGAGVIMRRGGSVQGINTAATLWAAGSMGLAIGAGYYKLGIAMVVTILIIQAALRPIASAINKRSGMITPLITYHLDVSFKPESVDSVHAAWSSFEGQSGVEMIRFSENKIDDTEVALGAAFGLSQLRAGEMTAVTEKLAGIPGVTRAEWSQTTTEEPE